MLNPALVEIAATERIADMHRTGAKWFRAHRADQPAATTNSQARSVSLRHARLAKPQQTIGWFLVSVGLRLALSRTPGGSPR